LDSKQKILLQAKLLFAQQGYSGISVRHLAKAVNMSPAALYHHFPDKKTLYLETVKFAFANQADTFSEVWASKYPPEQKLRLFVACLVDVMLGDLNFHRLMQRELIDADPERMKFLAEGVFQQQFIELMAVLKQLVPNMDAHMGAVSVIGLVCHQLEMQPLKKFLPGWKVEHEQPNVIAEHVINVLVNSITSEAM
jgi:AcrR family transcriptional regulator